MKKQLFTLLLTLAVLLSLPACGSLVLIEPADTSGGSKPADTSVSDTQTDGGTYAGAEYTDGTGPLSGETTGENDWYIDEEGWYYSAEDVAEYLWTYGELPDNFLTKSEARDYGWNGGSVEDYAGEGYAIGGDKFGNREGLLPRADGRQYYECDIGTLGEDERGPERLVFSNDGLIYYTDDHYETFELLYGEE